MTLEQLLLSLRCRSKARGEAGGTTTNNKMKNFTVLTISFAAATTFAQGLVNFQNTPTTLVSAGRVDQPVVISGSAGAYYFGLLTSPVQVGTYSFTGLYGTNLNASGLFSGGANLAVPGWAAGAPLYYEIAGWSASMGHDWNPQWLKGEGFPPYGTSAFFGLSSIGLGVAGGATGNGTLPAFDLFGGSGGLQSGFILAESSLVPEPSVAALFALGTFAAVCYRRTTQCTGLRDAPEVPRRTSVARSR